MDNSFNNLDVALHAYLDASDMPREHFDTLLWNLFSPDEGIVTFGGDVPANLPAALRDAIQNVLNDLDEDDGVDNFQEWMEEFDQAYFGQNNNNSNGMGPNNNSNGMGPNNNVSNNNQPPNNNIQMYLSNSNSNNDPVGPTGGKRRKTRKSKKSKKSRKTRKTRKTRKSKKSKKSKRSRKH